VAFASESSRRLSSAQRRALERPAVLPLGWKGAALGDRVDDGIRAGADGWTRKASRSEAARAVLAPALASAGYLATAVAVASSGCGRGGGVDVVDLVTLASSAPGGGGACSKWRRVRGGRATWWHERGAGHRI
jgi:hypothetical protein